MRWATARAWSTVSAMSEAITGWPISSMASLNSSRSSARVMERALVPSRRTPASSRKPSLSSCMAMVRPVWPPRPARMASGCSLRMMRLMVSVVSGSR